MQPLFDCGIWLPTKDGDATAYSIFKRHYTFKNHPRRSDLSNAARRQFVGPGEKMVLMTFEQDALFVWRKFIDDCPGQYGVNCAVFRNEGLHKASALILEAEILAWQRWPEERLYTYVNPGMVNSEVPGYCFRRARWKHCGQTGSGLMIFEKLPRGGRDASEEGQEQVSARRLQGHDLQGEARAPDLPDGEGSSRVA